MKLLTTQAILASATLIALSGAFPAELKKRRQGDSPDDPIIIEVDCSKPNYARVCDADCFGILCAGEPNPAQWDKGHNDEHRKASGASSKPFQKSEQSRQKHGIVVSQDVLNRVGTSPEETLMANTVQGGDGDIIVPVNEAANKGLGGQIGSKLRANAFDKAWYKRVFINFGTGAPYCTALQSTPPDLSICNKQDKAEDDVMRTAMIRMEEDNADRGSQWHMFQPGDRWTGHRYQGSGGSSKREEQRAEEEEETL